MRELTPEEIAIVWRQAKWATICTVTRQNKPYAIEATPFCDGGDICLMINPRGSTWKNLQHNPHLLLKAALTDRALSWWIGVSSRGLGSFDDNPGSITREFDQLGKITGTDYTTMAEKHCRLPGRSPLLRVAVHETSGRCSASPGEPLMIGME